MKVPAGYTATRVGTARAFALVEASDWLERVLTEAGSLHAWAASAMDATPLEGRRPVYAVPAQVAGILPSGAWAVRRYARGGAAAVLGDRYARFGRPRPDRELVASVEARARGVRTPKVVAGAVYTGGLFYRGDLVTELVPDATPLDRAVFGRGTGRDRAECLRCAGRLVRSLEDARCVHIDLHARNVLLTSEAGERVAHVVDLDRCRVLPTSAPPPSGAMRKRLARSLTKLARECGDALSEAELEALASGFEERA